MGQASRSGEAIHLRPAVTLHEDHRRGARPSVTSCLWLSLEADSCLRKGRKDLSNLITRSELFALVLGVSSYFPRVF